MFPGIYGSVLQVSLQSFPSMVEMWEQQKLRDNRSFATNVLSWLKEDYEQ